MEEKQRIMVVDDEPRNQRIITETLDGLANLQFASTGEEALSVMESFCPDLVLLDAMMPGLDGYETCKRIRANKRMSFAKVVLVSGKALVEDRLKGYHDGADDFLTKPFIPEELLAKTKVFLRLTKIEKNLSEFNQSLESIVLERTQELLNTEVRLINTAKMAALGEMAGGIAHEINTPLGTIGMASEQIQELLSEEPLDKSLIIEMAQMISTTTLSISGIIRGLRAFSREGSCDQFESCSLKKLFEDTLSLCQERLKYSGIQVTVASLDDELKVYCRSIQISQVLLNLINNACDAVALLPEKWIRIEARQIEDKVEISITDSGNGVPEPVRGKIFQPFFTTKDIGKGTGLGLSISKGIVDTHQGSLELDSQCVNTKFVLRLPSTVSE